ncbi:unnamed protein product, partial [Phaeothamnion confervicola]
RRRLRLAAAAAASFALSRPSLVQGDFVFSSFNDTTGLTFVGSAATSACVNKSSLAYGAVEGNADLLKEMPPVPPILSEKVASWSKQEVETSAPEDTPPEKASIAGFGNREGTVASPDARHRECPVRARLTPSAPSRAGALWYDVPVAVATGLPTCFVLHPTAHRRVC